MKRIALHIHNDAALAETDAAMLKKAAVEGRLAPDLARKAGIPTGEYVCGVCGMRHWTRNEAASCCNGLPVVDLDYLAQALGNSRWIR